jgi:two-component system cell cycle response regulator DivK
LKVWNGQLDNLHVKAIVLLAEDFDDARDMYAEHLACAGFDVVTACDGAEALEAAARVTPDLVLMDLMMPVLDGWEATRRLKADERLRHIPVLALTAHSSAEHLARAKAAGCDGVILKPCVPDELTRRVRSALNGNTA